MKLSYFFLSFIVTVPIFGYDHYLVNLIDSTYNGAEHILVLGSLESGMRGLITLIQDGSGQKFVVKQYKVHDFDTEFGVVREALASYVGESVGISLNHVRIIPAEHGFPGKVFPLRPATLHTFASGTRVDRHKNYSDLTLRQRWKSETAFARRGLTYKIIKCMARHIDLPRIVAFDTFVSNSGRLNKNLFYDDNTDRFYGIDLEQSFRKPFDYSFAEISCHNVRAMIHDKKVKFTKQEFKGLVLYVSTLKKLIQCNKPEKLHALLDILLFQSGLNPEFYMQDYQTPKVDILACIVQYKKRIEMQCKYAGELVDLLDTLLSYHSK